MSAWGNAMDATRMWEVTRDEMGLWYAAVLRDDRGADWPALNAAIIERWSESALVYIKRRAWQVNNRLVLAAASRTATGEDTGDE